MAQKSLSLPANMLPLGSLEAYLQRINQIPLLSANEESQLATRYVQHQDLAAAQQLVLSHLRYVARIAKGYLGYGLALADLIQEGSIGLMKAVKRFDPEQQVRLASFAVHWIKAEIHEFVLRNWRIVKVATTKPQRKLFFNLRQAKKRLGWSSKEEIAAIAQDLGVRPEEVTRMEERLNAHDTSFDLSPEDEDGKTLPAPVAYLNDADLDPSLQYEEQEWDQFTRARFKQAMSQLDARAQDILQKRWLKDGEKETLQALAQCHGISIERVRQLEKNAIQKLKELVE